MYHQTFLWLTTCNRDALHLKDLHEHLTALFQLQCTWCRRLELENGHLSTATLSIKGQHWPPCHKMACSGYSLFDFPASLSPSWFMLFISKRFLVVPAVKYYKSSIMLPLAYCTRIDAALEQVGLLLCVFFQQCQQRPELSVFNRPDRHAEVELQARHCFIQVALA